MNNEFKKLSQGEVTRYVLENASGGGTSSGSVASVSMPIGGTRKRGNNLIAQEADKKTVPASTPRNFVAKNAKTAGAGAHKDKSKTIPRKEKHKKPFMEDRDHPDHEIQMASSELMSIAKNAQSLLDMVQRYSEQEGLDAWQQSKITKAADYLNSVLQSINGEQQGVEEGDAGLSKDAETNFHAKLDQLVHATFGKRKEEQGVAEGDHEGMYSPEAIKMGNHFIKEFNLIDDMDQQLAIEIVDNCLDGGLTDPNQIRKQVIKYLKQSGTVIQRRKQDVAEGLHPMVAADLEKLKTLNPVDRYSAYANIRGYFKADPALSKMASDLQGGYYEAEMLRSKYKTDAAKAKYAELEPMHQAFIKQAIGQEQGVAEDTYFESLQQMVERQLEPTMDLDAWVDNFQNADQNKYHQFKNKTLEKKK